VVVLGIIAAVALPRLGSAQRHGTVKVGTQKVHAYLVTARIGAMRRGRPTTFHAVENSIWVTSLTPAGGVETIAAPIPLDSDLGVTLDAGAATVSFNSRGFTDLNSSRVFRISRTGFSDSVCVSRAGVVGRCGF
jgi:type II secretory pathway pseudopilin PulG